jgi:hypothetical protein
MFQKKRCGGGNFDHHGDQIRPPSQIKSEPLVKHCEPAMHTASVALCSTSEAAVSMAADTASQ